MTALKTRDKLIRLEGTSISNPLWFSWIFLFLFVFQVLILWPVQFPSRSAVDQLLYVCNRFITPIVFLAVTLRFLEKKSALFRNKSAILYSLALVLSALVNQKYQSLFLAAEFLLISFVFDEIRKFQDIAKHFIPLLFGIFLWMTLPLMILTATGFGNWENYFWKSDLSYHGFADSRVVFGLVASILCIYVFSVEVPSKTLMAILMSSTIVVLYFSQSRAAVFSTALALAYTTANSERFGNRTLNSNLVRNLLIAIMAAGSWKLFGRQEPLTLTDPNRDAINTAAFMLVKDSNIFLGAGQMTDIVLSNGGVTQAHNLIVQWFLNWGLLGVISLSIYIYSFAKATKTREAKGALGVLFLYSCFQPIQGTANIFSPITLWLSLIILISDTYFSKKSPTNFMASQNSQDDLNWKQGLK